MVLINSSTIKEKVTVLKNSSTKLIFSWELPFSPFSSREGWGVKGTQKKSSLKKQHSTVKDTNSTSKGYGFKSLLNLPLAMGLEGLSMPQHPHL